MPRRVIETITQYLGRDGTLAVLAPCYDYSNLGVPFDTRRSPVSRELGVLSATVAEWEGAERSANPIFSVAAVGAQATYICNGPNASAFGIESAWDRVVRLGGKVLLLGSGVRRMTLARYIEQHAGVPYLYTKLFRTPIFRDGVPLPYPVTALLRYANLPLQYDLLRFGERLYEQGIMRNCALGGGQVQAADAESCVRAGITALNQDLHYFLAVPPAYDAAELPLR